MKYRLLGACAAAICCTAAPAFAQGLSRVEVLALQQQLRDDGCGVSHVTGHLDAMTRTAVKKCESKYSGATDPASMLAAMNIGFGDGISPPTLAGARSGNGGTMSAGGTSGLMNESAVRKDTTNGRVDLNKATPMTPPAETPPVTPPTPPGEPATPPMPAGAAMPAAMPPAMPPTPPVPTDTTARPRLPANPRDTLKVPRDTSTMPPDTSSMSRRGIKPNNL